jgi:hypothetical protein
MYSAATGTSSAITDFGLARLDGHQLNQREDSMKIALPCVLAAALIAGPTAASAGEITGPPPAANLSPLPGTTISNGNSLCSFSGLNDTPDGFAPAGDPGGIVQSFGYFMATAGIYDPSDPAQRDSFLFPSVGCNPQVQGGTH